MPEEVLARAATGHKCPLKETGGPLIRPPLSVHSPRRRLAIRSHGSADSWHKFSSLPVLRIAVPVLCPLYLNLRLVALPAGPPPRAVVSLQQAIGPLGPRFLHFTPFAAKSLPLSAIFRPIQPEPTTYTVAPSDAMKHRHRPAHNSPALFTWAGTKSRKVLPEHGERLWRLSCVPVCSLSLRTKFRRRRR